MAIDFDAALTAGYEMENDLNELITLLRIYKEGKVFVPLIGDILFNPAQKTILEDRYSQLKSQLQTNYGQLP